MPGTRPGMTNPESDEKLPDRRSTRSNARRLAGHDAVEPLAFLFEASEHRALENAAARQLDAHRVNEAAVDQDLVVQVRACREAGRADKADHLALPHAGA